MVARVIIYDDNDNSEGVYELKPSRVYDYGISTKYVFEFEYNQLNKTGCHFDQIEEVLKD